MVRSGRAGIFITLDSRQSSPSSGWSSSLRICPASSMSRRSHRAANSGLSAMTRASSSRSPSSSGVAEHAARNWATTEQAFASQLRERERYIGSVKKSIRQFWVTPGRIPRTTAAASLWRTLL